MNFRQPDVRIRSSHDVPKQTYLCVETLKNRLAGWSRQHILNFRLVSKLIYSNRQKEVTI